MTQIDTYYIKVTLYKSLYNIVISSITSERKVRISICTNWRSTMYVHKNYIKSKTFINFLKIDTEMFIEISKC